MCLELHLCIFYEHGSVHYSGADVTACDNSNLNPFVLALQKSQKSVAKLMLEKASAHCFRPLGPSETIQWALEKNLTLFFEVWQLFYTLLIIFIGKIVWL